MYKIRLVVLLVFLINITNGQSNSDNPYDFVGKAHNEIIQSTKAKLDGNESNSEIVDIAYSETIKNSTFKRHINNEVEVYKLTNNDVNNGIQDAMDKYENILKDIDISDASKNIISQLINKIYDANDESLTYQEFYDYVIGVEDNLVKNKSRFKERDYIILLSSTSVARYSACAWTDCSNEAKSNNSDGSWWIVGADVVGGIIGGAAASPGFLSSAAGAISGASGASSVADKVVKAK